MNSIFITGGRPIDTNLWTDFMETCANSEITQAERPYICRVIQPPNLFQGEQTSYRLALMNSIGIKRFFETHSRWDCNCGKMQFVEVIRISRILLSFQIDPNQKKRVTDSLRLMADKAESKYQSSWMGTVRKIYSWVCNLFVSNDVGLFNTTTLESPSQVNDHLPFFVGSDATFARLVADSYS